MDPDVDLLSTIDQQMTCDAAVDLRSHHVAMRQQSIEEDLETYVDSCDQEETSEACNSIVAADDDGAEQLNDQVFYATVNSPGEY